MSRIDPYSVDLDRNPANYVPLTPLSFLARAAEVFPERVAVVHGDRRLSWAETYRRCRQLASALTRLGIGAGGWHGQAICGPQGTRHGDALSADEVDATATVWGDGLVDNPPAQPIVHGDSVRYLPMTSLL